MSEPNIRVLIVDDSAFTRKVIRDTLGATPGIEVVGYARDGLEALELVESLQPDVMTLDVHMPELDGLGVLEALKARAARNAPRVVIVSTVGAADEEMLRALELGAVDLVRKPTAAALSSLYDIRGDLVDKVRTAAASRVVLPDDDEPAAVASVVRGAVAGTSLIVIGASTGGPNALSKLLPQLPADLPVPVALVLHIVEGFTRSLAERLDRTSALRVIETYEGRVIQPGEVAVAPGGAHLTLRRNADGTATTRLTHEPESLHRPSVDVLFSSAAAAFGRGVLGVVLTGMGEDGLAGSRAIRGAGGRVITELERSCVVYGMPRAVYEAGLSTDQASIARMSETILRHL